MIALASENTFRVHDIELLLCAAGAKMRRPARDNHDDDDDDHTHDEDTLAQKIAAAADKK